MKMRDKVSEIEVEGANERVNEWVNESGRESGREVGRANRDIDSEQSAGVLPST
jgi:hypothetical protein